jgi:phosphoribosylformylglycinamidine synthase I
MEKRPQAILLKFPGTNCDGETARALGTVGFDVHSVPFSQVRRASFDTVDLVVIPGGFSYGDYIMAGRLAQLEIERRLGDALNNFRDAGGHILGICNGFQILLRLRLLPEGSLIENSSARFLCRWVGLRNHSRNSPFLRALPDTFELPIAHAEGRFVSRPGLAERCFEEKYVALTYVDDVNGSELRIAGLQDKTGRVLGLMPHPERFLFREDHYDPDWRLDLEWGWGQALFRSIAEEVAKIRNSRNAKGCQLIV